MKFVDATFNIPSALYARLMVAEIELEQSKSSLVTEAICDYLDTIEKGMELFDEDGFIPVEEN